MIRFVKKSDPQPAAEDTGGENSKKIREDKKAANDSKHRAAPRAAEDDDGLV
ncbi:hypothetical protein RLEG3_15635 [Rhizobium leguminosarum bv. trifolii WSM1689]|uniref:hypothetical protein n=1 Tax=Rhizobium leguminosarum TaxID=384 RepID=UPI0003E08982|nr:hypothetical protein [Rhizobium leguminosarum]AHF83163.1 hypothetical protein RLEG3_15635 [Rhizobium leguminosarum bv. trifolii WSM1689]MBY5738751.1 hypothetical protein [Rhizobium leguminosarum]